MMPVQVSLCILQNAMQSPSDVCMYISLTPATMWVFISKTLVVYSTWYAESLWCTYVSLLFVENTCYYVGAY